MPNNSKRVQIEVGATVRTNTGLVGIARIVSQSNVWVAVPCSYISSGERWECVHKSKCEVAPMVFESSSPVVYDAPGAVRFDVF